MALYQYCSVSFLSFLVMTGACVCGCSVTDKPPAPLMAYADDPLSPQNSPYEVHAVGTPGSAATDEYVDVKVLQSSL